MTETVITFCLFFACEELRVFFLHLSQSSLPLGANYDVAYTNTNAFRSLFCTLLPSFAYGMEVAFGVVSRKRWVQDRLIVFRDDHLYQEMQKLSQELFRFANVPGKSKV